MVLLLLLATALPSVGETVVGSIPAPDYAGALTWDGVSLWCGMYGPSGSTVYELDPADGTVLSSFTGQGDDSYGLAWDGSALWQLDSYNYDMLFRMNTSGGLLDSIPSITTYMAGLTWDGTYLWCAAYYNPDGWIYQIDPATGLEVHSFAAPAHQPWGLAWDGTDLWYVNDDFSGEEAIVYRLDPTDGTVLEQFDSPGANPRGLTWDGSYLWVCADNNAGAGRRCYQIDPGGSGTADIDLHPTSQDLGIVPVNTVIPWTLHIDNVGTADLTVSGMTSDTPQFNVADFPNPLTITAGDSYSYTSFFTSATTGYFEATITVSSDDPDEPEVTAAITVTAVLPDPVIALSATSHDFDQRRRYSRSRWPLTIGNNGYAPLVISDMDITSAAPGDEVFSIPDFIYPITLNTFETIEVDVDFSVPATGTFSGALEITSNGTDGGMHTVDLHGTGKTNFLGKGLPLWVFQGVENVECTAQVPDVTGDGITDAAVESYDAGASSSEPHLSLIWGNSDGEGVVNWGIHPPGGPSNSGGYGDKCLDVSPDINGDGLADILLATAWGGCTCYAVNGRNGGILWSYDMYNEDPDGGWVYAAGPAGDITGDKVPDALFGAGGHDSGTAGPRSMYAFDGASSGTAATLWRQYANDAIIDVVNLGDVNGDEVNDAAACAGGNTVRDNHVYCVSGASSGPATTLWAFDTGGDNWSLTRHSDVTGDGASEVVVGTWGGSPAGIVTCLDGAGDPTAVWTFTLVSPVMRVDSFADVTGDGINEVLVASWASWAYCLNGATGVQLWSSYMGSDVWAVSGIPDVNGDGYDDALAGAFTGEVRCIDGTSGDTIWSYMTGSKIFTLRWIEDVNGDTYPDVLAGTQMLGGIGGELFCLTGGDLPTWDRHAGVRAAPRPDGIEVELTGTKGFVSRGINVYRRQIFPETTAMARTGISGITAPAPNLPERIKALEARRAMHTALLDGFQQITPRPARGSVYLDRTAAPGARYEYILGVVTDLGDEVFSEAVEAGR